MEAEIMKDVPGWVVSEELPPLLPDLSVW